MSRFKTEGDRQYRSMVGRMRVLAKESPFLYRVEVWLLNGLTNRNKWRYENLEQHRALFAGTPLLVAYVHGGNKVGDGHNFRMKRDKGGEEYASFTDATSERIVGWFPDENQIRIEEKNGTKWIVGVGYIWTWYARELVNMLEEQGAEGMDVSIETLVDDVRMDGDTEVFGKYEVLGTTILGKGVTPAVAGASIRAFHNIGTALNEFKLRVASEQSKQKGVKKLKNRTGYYVLAETESRVYILSKEDGKAYWKNKEDPDDSEVTPASVKVEAEGEEAEIENALSAFANEISSLTGKLAEKEENLKNAKEKIQKMEEAEKESRKSSIIEAVRNKAKEIQENADSEMDESVCEEICKNVDKYVDSKDEEGNFNGDKKACADLAAKCMEKMLERKTKTNSALWPMDVRSRSKADGIDGLLDRINN